ncbi:MAG: molybdopterin synthase sulfur carrier subunit [Thermoprotei archaeon]|nr:MAG: molybdopterin synthase sulfur carrier subunit [Thermoprotei archaeon]
MKITVVLAGAFREVAGEKELIEELPEGASLKDLISALASRYDDLFEDIAGRSGEVSRDVALIVNNAFVFKLDRKLKDGDRVIISDLIEVSLGGG